MPRPDLALENDLWSKGYRSILGIDEVGRGSWAGPLVAAGVILPSNFKIPSGFGDSKQLSAQKRNQFGELIKKTAIAFKITEVAPDKINQTGIASATQFAFRKIIKTILPKPDFILIDAFYIKNLSKSTQNAIKKGDQISASIAAASIIAKVHRDNLMIKEAKFFPDYGFEQHKGYGTQMHQNAIKRLGFCKIHRTSYNLDFLFS